MKLKTRWAIGQKRQDSCLGLKARKNSMATENLLVAIVSWLGSKVDAQGIRGTDEILYNPHN